MQHPHSFNRDVPHPSHSSCDGYDIVSNRATYHSQWPRCCLRNLTLAWTWSRAETLLGLCQIHLSSFPYSLRRPILLAPMPGHPQMWMRLGLDVRPVVRDLNVYKSTNCRHSILVPLRKARPTGLQVQHAPRREKPLQFTTDIAGIIASMLVVMLQMVGRCWSARVPPRVSSP